VLDVYDYPFQKQPLKYYDTDCKEVAIQEFLVVGVLSVHKELEEVGP
jgi:hypothetical protein